MSQLRKSASFRSRIPVRRNRISQQRHCCSPQNFSGEVDGVKRTCACPPYCRLRAKRSIATAGVPLRSNSHHHFQSHRHAVRHSSKRRYSSSSFSSSDESCESEAPHQKLARQSRKIPLEFSMYVSTDAISLDGLLDSVSCGSFSSPPSPVSYQNTQESACFRGSSYESLDKYNIALENLEITENAPFLPYPLAHVRQSSEASLINKYNNKNNKRNFSHNSSNNYYNTNNRNNLQEEQITVYNQFKSNFRQNMSTEARQRVSNSRTAIKKSADGVSGTANDEASKKSYYLEKQKQLSDWYYIKTNKDAVVAAAAATDEAKHEDASQERAENGEKQDGDNLASRDNATEDASLQEHNYVNCTRQLQGLQGATTAIRTSQSATFVASLNRRTALGSARYATASTSHEVLSTSSPPQRQQPVRWNNFDHQMKPPSQQQQFQHNTTETNSAESRVRKYNVLDDIEVEYNEAVDAINRSELKSSAATTRPTCPPYYCPPTYSTHSSPSHDLPAQPTASAATAESDLSNVNVRLLKQHYQQQQARPQQPQRGPKTSTEYANMSFRRRVEGGKRSKNKVELQLEHWENIGNQKGGADVAGVKCGLRAALPDGSNKLRRDGRDDAFMHNANEEGHESSSHQQQQQQQQNQQLNCDNECFSNANDAAVNATTSCNNSNRINSSSDSINKPHNRANIIYQQQQQQQQQQSQQQQQQHQQQHHLKQLLLPDTLKSHSSQQQQQHHQHQYQQHPASTTAHSHRKMQEQQQQQEQQAQQQLQALYDEVETKEEDEDEEAEAESDLEEQCSSQPTAAPRRFAYTPTATPRTVLRSRQIQKRADETSCSSFEQLNIVGIPTGDDDVTPDEDADTHAFDVDASMATLALTRDDCGGAQQGFNNHRYSDDRDESTLQASATQQNATAGFLDKTEQNQEEQKTHRRIFSPSNRPLPELPPQFQHQQIQLHLKQNPQTRQHFGVLDTEMFPPKTTPTCRSECDLSGSYASLECPSPPGPPVSLPESRRDPQARLSNYLRTFYTDLALKEPVMPQWAIPVAPGALCAARLEPELRLSASSHGFCDTLTVDQILVSVQTKEGNFIEAPRRCLIECPSWASRSNLCLRILHAWAKEPPWPTKGTPVALALFIPLTELKRSFSQYVEKELLAKGPLNPFSSGIGGFSAAWNSLEALGPKLLFVLDGYESQKLGNLSFTGGTPKKSKTNTSLVGTGNKNHYPSDVHDLLEGKLFPEARVIIMTSSTTCPELLSIIQRHITYEGLTWGRSASLLGGGQWGGPCRLLDVIQESVHLRKVVRTPLGCLAVTAIYESSGGDLPTDELDIVESIMTCIAPEASAIHVSELGRLALFCLKMKRPSFTLAEMRMYCSSPESPLLGCLERNLLLGKTAKKKGEYIYNPVCSGMMELLAANYIASLASRPGLLAAEITGMAVGDELDADLLKVLKFAMTLLGDRAHILLSRLTPLWLTPQIVFTLALAGGPSEDNLAALCDILGISKHPPISPLETKPLWVQVRSVPTDLMGWGMALKSPTCTLKNLEVIYQLEKQNLLESRKAIEVFLDSLISNESVSTLKLSSLIEMDVKESEISYLAGCVSKILLKPRLENFELVLTLLEEDPPILKLQSVVAALCRTIPRQPRLSFLLLDLTLSTSQLVQLCATLEKCPNVTRLSLPHLRCERGAIAALASLLNSRPISFLSLPSCWGARDDPPSSSGVSMGSGSGSSTGTSGLIKQGSLPGVPSPRSYAPGIFSSLPRGVFVPQSSLGRSATLPRQPLEQTLDKRSCDSVVSKTWYPTPACDGGPHNSGTLHELFLAARDSYSKLHGFDLSKAQLSLEDSMCLGETVRLSNTLHTLKLEGSSRLSEVLPSVLGASESSCLQMLSIGSPRLSLEDSAIAMCARALTSCSTLRLLSLDGWSFRVENPSTLSIVRAFLSLTSIRELSLANCRLQIGLVKSDVKISHAFESRSVVVLKLAGAQATLGDSTVIRGPQLLQYIGGFPCLRELDLSAPARSGLGSTHTTPLILDDKCIVNFFQNLHTHFGLLNTLKICHWVIHFDEMSKTLKTISKCMRNSPISHLKVDGICVLDRPKKQRSEVNLIHCFIASLPQIRWMGISLAGKKEEQITGIGNAVLDLKGYEIDIKLSESTIEHAKLMAQAISLDGKFDIKVSTFGTSSGILVHAEKSGTKSLTRKTKD